MAAPVVIALHQLFPLAVYLAQDESDANALDAVTYCLYFQNTSISFSRIFIQLWNWRSFSQNNPTQKTSVDDHNNNIEVNTFCVNTLHAQERKQKKNK